MGRGELTSVVMADYKSYMGFVYEWVVRQPLLDFIPGGTGGTGEGEAQGLKK